MDEFVIYHVPWEENPRANALAQQASGYNVQKRNFQERKPLLTAECFALETSVTPMQPTGLTGDTGLTGATDQSDRSPDISSSSVFRDKNWVEDWKKSLVNYLHNPSNSVDRKNWRWALKFILDDGELYRQTANDFLLKCLGLDQARLAMAEVH
jgi:hypothetical protein